jgi:hypothetical protein
MQLNRYALITAFVLTFVVLGVPILILLVRDRLWPAAKIENEGGRTAKQRSVMKLWVAGAILLLVAKWLTRTK